MEESYVLTELQLSVMRVLWDLDEATVSEVCTALRDERDLAQTTVATLLKRLEARGLLAHRSEGRQFVYRAAVTEDQVRRSMVSDLTDRLFSGDATALVSHLLSNRDVEPGDLAEVKAMIEAFESREGDRSKPNETDEARR